MKGGIESIRRMCITMRGLIRCLRHCCLHSFYTCTAAGVQNGKFVGKPIIEMMPIARWDHDGFPILTSSMLILHAAAKTLTTPRKMVMGFRKPAIRG